MPFDEIQKAQRLFLGESLWNGLFKARRFRQCSRISADHPEGFETGYFVKPTVFVNVKNDMTIAKEEIFGPVLSVIAYASEDEAIQIANDSNYGLHAAVLGTDLERARHVASQIRAGRVVINAMTDDPQAPWGGFKYSRIGREYCRYGIEAFLETKAILE
jgi:aldehyde dehydrogenase (NAD+)